MRTALRFLAAPLAALCVALPSTAFAQAIFAYSEGQSTLLRLTTVTGSFDLAASNRGWYDNTGGPNGNDAGSNYIAGLCLPGPCNGSGAVYRNWFAFDLANLNGNVTGASLVLQNNAVNGFISPNLTETYSVYDVSTLISSLGVATGVGIYGDLGSGVMYGSQSVSLADNGMFVSVGLNAAAISAINSAAGGSFAIGGTVDPSTVVPEPATVVLLGTGMLLVGFVRRRRA